MSRKILTAIQTKMPIVYPNDPHNQEDFFFAKTWYLEAGKKMAKGGTVGPLITGIEYNPRSNFYAVILANKSVINVDGRNVIAYTEEKYD
ncbi:hypothetical protein M8332_07025 (plasmid) [Fructilactobacillus ixorae]|uniref:Uncharacterized protein n=1 Tax=Fructilactobacillus ixorae TaxID=1750535 RepID=A0ABY5C741_9LACO|nr:hypothetical protein [Fructilactobacillus ixorae]USS93968.1 hypothetical protein M8332_07025 [Fructilactobacillus ixorae]